VVLRVGLWHGLNTLVWCDMNTKWSVQDGTTVAHLIWYEDHTFVFTVQACRVHMAK
jgi:hypothetical protein